MKKIIALLLVLVMSLGLLAGCAEQGNTTTTAGAAGSVKDAKDYLYAMYKDSSVAVTRDFSRVAVVAINGVSYKVTWTTDVSEDLVKITATETMATIDINEKPTEDVTFKLTATIEDAEGNKETVEFTHTIAAVATTGTLFVETFEVGTAYKFALQQNAIDGCPILYFTGEKSGNYLATSTNPLDAVDVTVEEAEGGYYLTFLDGETKKYINITTYTKDDGSLSKTQDIGTEPTCVYTWDAERGTMIAYIEALEESFYLGTYNTYNTMSTSSTSYIEDVSKIGDTQFPAGFCTITAEIAETPVAGKAYVWGMQQNGIDGQPTLYFTGEKSGNYLATSTNLSDAVRVYLEETEGGYHLFFLADGVKTYINITTYTKDDGSLSKTQDIGAEPTCVYTWDAERGTMIAYIEALEESFYLGTYGTYNTISTSSTSYIEDVSKIGDSQFPAVFYDLGLPVEEIAPSEGDENEGEKDDTTDPVTPDNNGGTTTADPAADTELTIEQAIALGASKEHNTYTEGKYYVTGTITEIYNTQYGNMYITDGNGNTLTIYGTYSADGSTRFDAMTTQPAAGATVKIYGIIGQYNGTAQIKNGWIVEQSGATNTPAPTPTPTPTPTPSEEPACVTTPEIGKAYKLGLWQSNKTAVYYFTGAMSGYYGATETDKALAVDVYLEDAGNGAFHIYFMDGSTKNYLYGEANGTHLNFKFGSTKGVFTWNATYNTLMTTIGDTVVFMGTYSNYVTFGMSAEDKIETSYAAHLYN